MEQNKLDDDQLMHLIAKQDKKALEVLYDRYASAVMGLAFRFLNNRQTAEEVVQETFWRVWEQAATFDATKGKCITWIFTIVRRYSIDLLRKANSRPSSFQSESEVAQFEKTPSPLNVFKNVSQLIQSETIRKAILKLPPEQSEVIHLAYFKGLTRREIAKATKTPVGTVHTRARLALQKLRLSLVSEDLTI